MKKTISDPRLLSNLIVATALPTRRTMEPAVPHNINYELLTEIELAVASRAKTAGERRRHLDQAAVYATLGEKYRDERALLVLAA